MLLAAGAAFVVAAALVIGLGLRSGGGSTMLTVPPGPVLASIDSEAQGEPVDNIECQTSEQVLFHIHAYLAVFVNGQQRTVPAGIGIPGAQVQTTPAGPLVASGQCFYWLHSHTADGIIHIESPLTRLYTLGNYFDIWGEPLSATQVGPAQGTVTAYVNGRRFTGNPRDIPLMAHAEIQLDVGSDVAPAHVTFPAGL
jgi:hypothetical protein